MLVPFPSPWHSLFIQAALDSRGINCSLQAESDPATIAAGLTVVNNDACYDTIVAAGQVLEAVRELRDQGQSDPVVVAVPLFCNECRVNDKIYFIKQALKVLGCENTKVDSFFQVLANPGNLSSVGQMRLAAALIAADCLLQMRLHLRPYIATEKLAYFDGVIEGWRDWTLSEIGSTKDFDGISFMENLDMEAAKLFGLGHRTKPVVGIAGSVSAVFNPTINGDMITVLESEGCEVRLPYLSSILSYTMTQQGLDCALNDELNRLCHRASEAFRVIPGAPYVDSIENQRQLVVPDNICRGLGGALSGWMLELMENGIDNVVYATHFGCLSGHVSGAGVLGSIRKLYPEANIASVEYDAGTSELNAVNRLKLMAAIAHQKAEGKN